MIVFFACVLAVACGGRTDGTKAGARAPDGAAGADTGPSAAPAGGRRLVLIAGTSLTAGLGLAPEDAYPALLQRKADSAGLAFEFRNAGVSGETSAGLLRRLDWILREPADVVVIETGANDGLRGIDVAATSANVREIVRKVKAAKPGAAVMLMQMEAPPNLGARYTSGFHAMFPEIAQAEGVTLVPFLLDRVAGVARLNQSDGIHPNEEGERIVADNVWRAIEPVLRGRE